MGGKINKSAAIHTIKRILKKTIMILIINFRFCVDGGASMWRQAEDVFRFLNRLWLTAAAYSRFSQGSICMKFLHRRQLFFVIAGVRPRGALTKGKILLSGLRRRWQTPSWEPSHGRGFPRRRSGTSLSEIRSPISEPVPLGLQVNRGKLYANVTFS